MNVCRASACCTPTGFMEAWKHLGNACWWYMHVDGTGYLYVYVCKHLLFCNYWHLRQFNVMSLIFLAIRLYSVAPYAHTLLHIHTVQCNVFSHGDVTVLIRTHGHVSAPTHYTASIKFTRAHIICALTACNDAVLLLFVALLLLLLLLFMMFAVIQPHICIWVVQFHVT